MIPAIALPPIIAVPVSAEMRLGYVLRHFQLAYVEVPTELIGYAGSQRPIGDAGTKLAGPGGQLG